LTIRAGLASVKRRVAQFPPTTVIVRLDRATQYSRAPVINNNAAA
jgi:hypothetical protein